MPLTIRDTIKVNPEMAQMLELWDNNFKSHALIFKYVKEPWRKDTNDAWTVGEFEQREVNSNNNNKMK